MTNRKMAVLLIALAAIYDWAVISTGVYTPISIIGMLVETLVAFGLASLLWRE